MLFVEFGVHVFEQTVLIKMGTIITAPLHADVLLYSETVHSKTHQGISLSVIGQSQV